VPGEPPFLADLADPAFLVHDVFGIGEDVPTEPTLASVHEFCREDFARSGRRADREGCRLDPDGRVRVPSDFARIHAAFRARFAETFGDSEGLHPSLRYAALEMLMGANPAYMTYFGFNGASIDLLRRHGGVPDADRMIARLRALEWSSCLCITEEAAGSDLSLIETRAEPDEAGAYRLRGEKRLISAGMHDLAGNILYFVLARTRPDGGNSALSCFVVPRFLTDAAGESRDNGVRCTALADKMGFNGCANATLTFGEGGETRGFLLGNRLGAGLPQLMELMTQARISTGIYALGISSLAYARAVRYAERRRQGRSFTQALNWRAPVLPIADHADVQRMLLEMRWRVEGGRALLCLLGDCQAKQAGLEGEAARRHATLTNMLTPLVKAYNSDQGWQVCELAIQVHGGNGYLRDHGVEQAARDVKVLSIWEGTNYIQSQYLIRDALGLGMRPLAREALIEAIDTTLGEAGAAAHFPAQCESLRAASDAWCRGLDRIAHWARTGSLEEVPKIATRFLELTAQLVLGWLLLRSAAVAAAKLAKPDPGDTRFLRAKIATMRFYFASKLGCYAARAAILFDDPGFELESSLFTPERDSAAARDRPLSVEPVAVK
jgi:acyl-CoA dehydrogenase